MTEHYEFDEYIKCPKCAHWFDSEEEFEAGLYQDDHLEGEAIFNMTCPNCNEEFEVKTRVYYKFSTAVI